jgi:secreted trypsin-like serine protease
LQIVNGINAYRGQFPWQAAIAVDDSSFCSGSVISNYWVLTAAHCRQVQLTSSICVLTIRSRVVNSLTHLQLLSISEILRRAV